MPAYASRMSQMEKSAQVMQTLFGSFANPDVISFAGGSPAPACLPIEEVHDIMDKVMTREGRGVEALQYNRPQGIPDLRQTICDTLLAPKGVMADPDDVVVVSGGLETMNLVCQLFIEPGDVILVESPTFMHCVEIFDMFQAHCVPCQMDDHGLVMEDVEEKIRQYHPKMIYTVPTFQNPTGKTLPADRRWRLAELGSAYDVIVLEDDPYRDIRYSGEDLAPIKTYDTTGNTILASSFSKIFSPGVRLGYVYARHDYIRKICDIKTATNSHSSLLAEVACAEFFKQGLYPAHHKKICDIYRTQRDAMLAALDRHLPAGTRHTNPDGGFFMWVQLPGGIDTTDMLVEASRDYHVAYVAGRGFYVEGGDKGADELRLSFSGVEPPQIEEGMRRLGSLVQSRLA